MAEAAERRYHFAFAKASTYGLHAEPLEPALAESWRPGASITRYGRRWHLSRIVSETDELEMGRIGFVSDDPQSTLRFDPELQDFVVGEAPGGVIVPFIIRKSDGVIAYQLHPGVVRETTFTGALQELLNSQSQYYDWIVESFVAEANFNDWLREYPLVTRFDITLDTPNPHYGDRDWVEAAVEEVRVESLRLVGKAREGQIVDTDADLFQQALDHVANHNYGKAKVTARDGEDNQESTWVKLRGQVARVAGRITLRAARAEDEASADLLTQALRQAPQGLELADLNAGDDDG